MNVKKILLMTILFVSCTSTANEISEAFDSALESTTSTTTSSTTTTTTTTTIPENLLQLLAYESYGENGKEFLATGTYGTKDVYITGQDELLIGYTYGENKDKDFVVFNDCKMLFGHQMYVLRRMLYLRKESQENNRLFGLIF